MAAGDSKAINTGNEELDKKIEQWLHWDKVSDFIHY
jgi:hypothetical protein